MSILRPEHLGTDKVGRGAGWDKTNATIAVAMALSDVKQLKGLTHGELFGALVENIIAAIQGTVAPSGWRAAGHAVAEEIERRMRV